ncbi:MAG: hypothetical protein UD936_07455 [Acutalibacteraceae bacterium]|nr:hypothetical protein [Acutalibacteraceae bacterium]
MQPNATRTITEQYKINRYTIGCIIYPVFCFLPVSKLSSIATACSSADCIAWVYILLVVTVLACPSLLATVVNGTPLAI